MFKTDLDQASENYSDWVQHSVATGSGGIHAFTKTAQSWNAKPAYTVGLAPPTVQQSLQALVDERSIYCDIVAPQALPVQAAGGGAHEAEPA
eukprot:1774785-Pyramimonas_sp.AAC.1